MNIGSQSSLAPLSAAYKAAGDKLVAAINTTKDIRKTVEETTSLPLSSSLLDSAISDARTAASILAKEVAPYQGSKLSINPRHVIKLATTGAQLLEISKFDQGWGSTTPANRKENLLRDLDLANSLFTEAARRIGAL